MIILIIMILVADTRERAVLKHEFEDITVAVRQITVGDYALVHNDKILAIFERKTHEDFIASIRDGRMENRRKLKELRETTDCVVIFIIEGKPFSKFKKNEWTKYKPMVSSIYHMMMRDNFQFMYTSDTQDTANTLSRFVKSMHSLNMANDLNARVNHNENIVTNRSGDILVVDNGGNVLRGGDGATLTETLELDNVDDPTKASALLSIEKLTERRDTPDDSIVIKMWKHFMHVGDNVASMLASNFTFEDIAVGGPEVDIKLENTKVNGRCLSNRIITSVKTHTPDVLQAIICEIPLISKSRAKIIMEKYPTVTQMLAATDIKDLKSGKASMGMGVEKNLKRFLTLKLSAPSIAYEIDEAQ
jgi:ERCC4-type nuclease